MTDLRTDIAAAEDWPEITREAVRLRRELHAQPELGWEERGTARRIRGELDQAGVPWRRCADTGTLATLASDKPGPRLALRADIDALPIQEALDDPWRSRVDGCMHACGHDGHTAALMAAVRWLKAREASLPGPVSLLFQPAEEGGHGAREMIADGALEDVECIFGWHNWPAMAFGEAVCPDGVVMAGNGTFDIEVRGRGGHASQPELCRDPVLAASAITLALQQVVSRRLPPQACAVLSLTSIVADSAPTVIPQTARLGGSIRIADMKHRDVMNRAISEIVTETAASYGVEATVTHHPRYGPTVNHAGPAAQMREALAEEFGAHWQADVALPIMASEDFSYYLEAVPGAFALVGAGGQPQYDLPCHSPQYRFNDDLLAPMARIFARLAMDPALRSRAPVAFSNAS